MNKVKTIVLILTTLCLINSQGWAADHDHAEAGHGGHADQHGHEGGIIELSPAQIRQAGIKIITVKPGEQAETLVAPGIVRYNAYRVADVTSLIDSVVDSRHVHLGEAVQQGAPLMTLKSSTLAQAEADWLRAQAEYRKSRQEHERLEPLAADGIVSQARLQQSRSAYETARAQQLAARATLVSYGLSARDITLLEEGKTFGLVTLRAAIDGTIVADDAVLGQHIAAGSRLMRIVDESTVWVEVNIPPSQLQQVEPGSSALVVTKDRNQRMTARLIGIHHELDSATRTAVVRLEVDNGAHALHRGMFVDAEIMIARGRPALLLPEAAIQQQGDERIVFVEEKPGRFERREIETGKAGMGFVAIQSGLKEGERVVVNGSFALLSELLKSGFEAHSH